MLLAVRHSRREQNTSDVAYLQTTLHSRTGYKNGKKEYKKILQLQHQLFEVSDLLRARYVFILILLIVKCQYAYRVFHTNVLKYSNHLNVGTHQCLQTNQTSWPSTVCDLSHSQWDQLNYYFLK